MNSKKNPFQRVMEEFKKYHIDLPTFFDEVRHSLFRGKLKKGQVDGLKAKLAVFKMRRIALPHAAYLLATSYWETAHTMQPVREAYWLSEGWRRKNLRYYPWYGRGDVQLTWEDNYRRVDNALGLNGALLRNPDLALDLNISAEALVLGIMNGWYNRGGKGPGLGHYVPKDRAATLEEFRQARRTVNIMDKATTIARIALKFQRALEKAGY